MSKIHAIQIYIKVSITDDNLIGEKSIYTCEEKRKDVDKKCY